MKIGLVLFLFIPLFGQQLIAHAESFNGNVKECMEQPKKCQQNQKPVNNISQDKLKSNSTSGGTVISFWDVTKMIFALILVIALLYYLLKFINKKSRSYQQSRFVQNFGGTSLGGNRSLQIVKAGKRILILGIGEDIRLLKEIDDQQEIEDFMKQYEEQVDHSLEPRDIVSKIAKRINGYKKKIESSQPTFQSLLKEQLSSIKKDRKNVMNRLNEKEKSSDE
jgi:flagellar protein FliO/FliZ